jgi:bifunctional DNA-binding transcriptional regulator/antitoxin component of YhaV-PrlF toxin-antitoxin module
MAERIGTALVLKNNKITVPKSVLALLNSDQGDYLGFYKTKDGIMFVENKVLIWSQLRFI